MDVLEVLKEKNIPHVVTLIDNSVFEELDHLGEINVYELGQGLAELNKNGICLLDIKAGVSREGVTKIADVSKAVLYPEVPEIPDELILPEGTNYVKFKSDSWALGNYIVKHSTGKDIPKRFLKSQNLLDKFTGENDILRKLLVIDPDNRAYSWDVFQPHSFATQTLCNVM